MSTLSDAGLPTGDYAKSVGIEPTDDNALKIDPSSIFSIQGTVKENESVVKTSYPVLVGGRYDSSNRTLGSGDVGALAVTATGALVTSTTISSATVVGDDAEGATADTNPVTVGGRYDSSDRTLTNGQAGAIALTAAGHVIVSDSKLPASLGAKAGSASLSVVPASDAGMATATNQSTANTSLSNIDGKLPASLGAKAGTASLSVVLASDQGSVTVAGAAAENANASGNPLLIGGRYDSSDRALGNTDVGAIALSTTGAVRTAPQWEQKQVTMFSAVSVNNGNTTTYELAIPVETSVVTLFIDDDQGSAGVNTLTYSLRFETAGTNFSNITLSEKTITEQYESEIITDLDSVPYLFVTYTNSSGFTAGLTGIAVYNQYKA